MPSSFLPACSSQWYQDGTKPKIIITNVLHEFPLQIKMAGRYEGVLRGRCMKNKVEEKIIKFKESKKREFV